MSEELLDLYNRELSYFRKLAGAFSEKHPGIAGNLKLGERVEDPHVSRLIEAFAYLNARVRLKIEDGFPELCEAILGVLYPEYLNPVPSRAIVSLKLHRSQIEMFDGFHVPAGSPLETQLIDGEPCRFRTCYPVHAWPIEMVDGLVETPPFVVPRTEWSNTAKGVVKLKLKTYADRIRFNQFSIDRLRFFLNGDSRYIYDLHELLLNNAVGVLVASSDKDDNPVHLPADVIQPVGFEQHESLLPQTSRHRPGYHLLTELFVFPEKFLFFDVHRLSEAIAGQVGESSELNIYIFLNRIHRNLEKSIAPNTFQINATPIVNLFEQRCEPVLVKATRSEFRLVPDARRPLLNEIYSIDSVKATSPERQQLTLSPLYSANHASQPGQQSFWCASRRKTEIVEDVLNAAEDLGTDLYLSVVGVDTRNHFRDFEGWTIEVMATCLNRDYPNRLPGNTEFSLTDAGEVLSCDCLVHPSVTARPNFRDEGYWKLISHLSLNHLSLEDTEQGAESMREMLRLYNVSNLRRSEQMIEGLLNLSTRRIVSRIGGELSSGFCKGTEITVLLDEDKFSGGGHYLFGAVLDRFFSLYTSINSFTKTVLKTQQQEVSLCSWPARIGDRRLV